MCHRPNFKSWSSKMTKKSSRIPRHYKLWSWTWRFVANRSATAPRKWTTGWGFENTTHNFLPIFFAYPTVHADSKKFCNMSFNFMTQENKPPSKITDLGTPFISIVIHGLATVFEADLKHATKEHAQIIEIFEIEWTYEVFK